MALRISSFGFSGAGFLAAYHLGVAQCLIDQGILPKSGYRDAKDPYPPLIGVSAGALLSAAVVAGVDPQVGMELVLESGRKAREGYFDVLHPGFSLIDVAEQNLRRALEHAIDGDDEFLTKLNGRLRIGLTDRRVFPPVHNPRAFLYVDHFRCLEDMIAAAVLSSFVPGVTGPVLGSQCPRNSAIARSTRQLEDMIQAGCVKKANGDVLQPAMGASQREFCWDGGLVNAFPYIDSSTVIVTPIAADFADNASINPSIHYDGPTRSFALNDRVKVHLTMDNLRTMRQIATSSSDVDLQARFTDGFDDARAFLNRHDLQHVFRSPTPTAATY